MATALTLDLPKLATMFLTEDGADVPSSFSNVVCNASNLAVFGFLPQTDPNALPLGITGPGTAPLTITADCNYIDRYSGKSSTVRKSKSLSVSVSGSEPGWIVAIDNT